MLPNTTNLLCGSHYSNLKPLSPLLPLQLVPFSFYRQTDFSFLYADTKDHLTTNIVELSFNQEGTLNTKNLQEFMGTFESNCFGDDHAFLLNKDGDIIYYDLNSKDTFFIEKQHPSPFDPIQVHNIGEHFVTCGGNVKNTMNENQKIIKLWHFEGEQLISKGRIVTGHSKPIENSFTLGLNRVISLSTDKTVRMTNLSTLKLEQVIPVRNNYYSGCQIDWNCCLLGGISKNIDGFDLRSKKMVFSHQLKLPIIQISEIQRLNEYSFIFSNVNHLFILDIRTFSVVEKGTYYGERISKISALSKDTLIIGNRDKNLQLWKFY